MLRCVPNVQSVKKKKKMNKQIVKKKKKTTRKKIRNNLHEDVYDVVEGDIGKIVVYIVWYADMP